MNHARSWPPRYRGVFNLTETSRHVGLAGLLCLALFAQLGVAGAYLGLVLMLVACVCRPRTAIVPALRDPLAWVTIVFVLYCIGGAWYAASLLPETAASQWEQARDWYLLGLFWLTAYWVSVSPQYARVLIALLVAGILTRLFLNLPWHDLITLLSGNGEPYQAGLWHIAFAFYLTVALLAVLLFWPRMLARYNSGAPRIAIIVLFGLIGVTLLTTLLLTKSRGGWIAAIVAVPITTMIAWHLGLFRLPFSLRPRVKVAAVVFTAVLAACIAIVYSGPLAERMREEQTTYAAIFQKDFDISKVPYTSVGVRIRLYHQALVAWKERPVFGWGPGSDQYLIRRIPWFSDGEGYIPPHFHNVYLEWLMRFGLVGTGLWAIGFWLVASRTWRAWRDGDLDDDMYLFLAGSGLAASVWSLFDIRLFHWDFRMVSILLVGMAVGLGKPRPWDNR